MTNCKYFDAGWCYAPDNVETNAAQGGCLEPKCCSYLKSQMTTEITLKLSIEELKLIDKYVELNDETRSVFDKIKDAYPEPDTLYDVIRNLGYSWDCCDEIVYAVEEFYKSIQEKNDNLITRAKKLNNDMKDVVGGMKENTDNMDELMDDLMKDPPEFLRFECGKTLEQLIERWWCDVFAGVGSDWDMETCIADLIDQVELFLPREQNSSGSQNSYTEVAVEAHNELLRKIKSKLRNKK